MAKPMTSRQRLLAAIEHREPDRVPVSPRVWAWVKEHYGSARWMWILRAAEEFDFDPIIYVDSPYPNYIDASGSSYQHLSAISCEGHNYGYLHDVTVDAHIERFSDHTLVRRTITTPAGVLKDCLRRHKPGIEYGIDPHPEWLERLVKEPSDLEALAFLLPQPAPGDFRDIAALQNEIGERGLLHQTIPSATDYTGGWTMKVEDLMLASLGQPSFVRDLFGLFQAATLAQTEAALQAGIRVIFSSCYFASLSAGWSPAFYRDFILPLVEAQASLVHRYGGVFHFYDDGRVRRILPWLAEAGIDVLSTLPPPPVGDIDLAEAKALVGDTVCLNGNIDLIAVVKDGSPELIQEKVREAILAAGPGGGFILGTSDSIREAPIKNVRAYFTAARRYGSYPDLGKG